MLNAPWIKRFWRNITLNMFSMLLPTYQTALNMKMTWSTCRYQSTIIGHKTCPSTSREQSNSLVSNLCRLIDNYDAKIIDTWPILSITQGLHPLPAYPDCSAVLEMEILVSELFTTRRAGSENELSCRMWSVSGTCDIELALVPSFVRKFFHRVPDWDKLIELSPVTLWIGVF